jgi:hypothetical protein
VITPAAEIDRDQYCGNAGTTGEIKREVTATAG